MITKNNKKIKKKGFTLVSVIALYGGNDALLSGLDVLKSNSMIHFLAKELVAFPIIYHWLGELRHLYWDATAKGLSLPQVRASSRALLIGAGVLTVAVALL